MRYSIFAKPVRPAGVYRVTWIYSLSEASFYIYHKISKGSMRFERKNLIH